MHTVVQRVTSASVTVEGSIVGEIEHGLLALVGIERGDTEADLMTTARKLVDLRIFAGRTPMDRSLLDVGGSMLVVSQFTLAANLRKGRRPSFDAAEQPDLARARVDRFGSILTELGVPVAMGQFGAHMQVNLLNDGPVTFTIRTHGGVILDSLSSD